MEQVIRYSSSQGPDQRFLHVDVTGRQFKLCRITGQQGGNLSFETISSNSRVPIFRAYDWSPFNESWVAVGQSSGEATLLRVDDQLQEPIHFQAGKPRFCNAIALSSQNLLAAGLDKVRTDFCLNVWDIQQRLSPQGSGSLEGSKTQTDPLHKLASSEPITSLKFFRDQPRSIVAGVKGQFVRLYDLRDPSDTNGLQFATRCVHNLAIDGQDENYFASCYPTANPEICVWDRRMIHQSNSPYLSFPGSGNSRQPEVSLEFKHAVDSPGQVWSLRFSRTQRGCLGVLSNTGHLKVYNIVKEFVSDRENNERSQKYGSNWQDRYPQRIVLDNTHDIQRPFVSTSVKQNEKSRVVSFDFMSSQTNQNQPNIITLAGDGVIKIMSPRPPPEAVKFSSTMCLSKGHRQIKPSLWDHKDAASIGTAVGRIRRKFEPHNPSIARKSSFYNQSRHQETILPRSDPSLPDLLGLLSIPRLRCQSNYFLKPTANKSIVADSYPLQTFWTSLERLARISQNKALIQDSIDLSYLGIHALWMEDLRLKTRDLTSPRIGNLQVSQIIETLTARLSIDAGKTTQTEYPAHRALCLYISGLAWSADDLETIVKRLIDQGKYTHAAAIALFSDDKKLAYRALKSKGVGQNHRMLAMAIAGAAKHNTDAADIDDEVYVDWNETLTSLASDLVDPYARSILAYIRTNSWSAVVNEAALPLKYRLLVALKWYSDTELTTYIKNITRDVVANGDIEGVILTGTGTSSAVDLLHNHVRRVGDVQTAVLSLAVGGAATRYIDDPITLRTFESWRVNYRAWLNSWGLKFDRVRFDVAVCRSVAGKTPQPKPKPQVKLVCGYCNQGIAQFDGTDSEGKETGRNPLMAEKAAAIGTVCPKCGRHLPRCGVCDLWLGSPDSSYLKWYDGKGEGDLGASVASVETTIGPQQSKEMGKETGKSGWDEMMRRFTVFCTKCSHGFHAAHARDWFGGYGGRAGHRVCPVSECGCICGVAV